MKKIFVVIALALSLSGCSILRVHKMDIEQGNLITPEKIARLHTGMSESQVKEIMGTPVLVNVFDQNQLVYAYTYQQAYHNMLLKNVTVSFRDGRVTQIQSCNGNC